MNEKGIEQALSMMQGALDEASTILTYTRIYQTLSDANAIAEMKEIISDELNHIERFVVSYAKLIGIEIAED